MSDKQKKYNQLMQDHEGTKRVFDKEIEAFDPEKFEEDLQEIVRNALSYGGTRRQIFSQLMAIAGEEAGLSAKQQAGNSQKGSQNEQR